jgi:hypothetical protein
VLGPKSDTAGMPFSTGKLGASSSMLKACGVAGEGGGTKVPPDTEDPGERFAAISVHQQSC